MIVIWLKPNNKYYYKRIKGTYKNYEVGDYNCYGHKVVLVIYPSIKRVSIKDKFKLSLIRYIKNW